jgi:microcystin-dependent protein
MSDQFIGEIRAFAGGTVPEGWLPCNGQILLIQGPYTALYSLIGNFFGGDGKTNFAVPNLGARVPIGAGRGPGLTPRVVADAGGAATVTLLRSEMAAHSHAASADAYSSGATSPVGNVWGALGRGREPAYFTGAPNAAMNPEAIGLTGGDQPHTNLPPYLALNFCIAYQGEFPPRP